MVRAQWNRGLDRCPSCSIWPQRKFQAEVDDLACWWPHIHRKADFDGPKMFRDLAKKGATCSSLQHKTPKEPENLAPLAVPPDLQRYPKTSSCGKTTSTVFKTTSRYYHTSSWSINSHSSPYSVSWIGIWFMIINVQSHTTTVAYPSTIRQKDCRMNCKLGVSLHVSH